MGRAELISQLHQGKGDVRCNPESLDTRYLTRCYKSGDSPHASVLV